MGKKMIDFEMWRNMSRGRESKAGGGIKSDSMIYTPRIFWEQVHHPFFWCRKMEKGRLGWSNSWELPGNGVNLSERVRSSIPQPLMYSYSFSRLKEKTLKENKNKNKKETKQNEKKENQWLSPILWIAMFYLLFFFNFFLL